MIPTCRDLTELVTRYLEGDMSFGERLRFQVHMGLCPPCRRYIQQMRTTRDALGQLPPIVLPPDVREDLMERFATWTDASSGPSAE